jgi:hypothetical protein
MGEQQEWRWFALIGGVCIIQTFFDYTPEGPWDSRSFSRGVVGLFGICSLYVSWFRYYFNKKGLVPTIDLWKNPQSTWRKVLLFGILCYLFVIILKSSSSKDYFPETTGMVVLLIGSFAILNSLYVWLVVCGPLSKKEGLEQE